MILGVDGAIMNDIIVGLALGASLSDTTARQGTGNYANLDTRSITVSPYAAYVVTDYFYIDGMLGFTSGETDSDSYNAANVVQDRYDNRGSWTWFASGNLNYMRYWEGFDFLATTGFTWSRTRLDPVEDSTGANRNKEASVSRMLQTSLQAGYPLEDALPLPVTPYGRATWIYDINSSDTGEHGARLALGFDVVVTDMITASAEGTALVGKYDQEEYGMMANLNVAF